MDEEESERIRIEILKNAEISFDLALQIKSYGTTFGFASMKVEFGLSEWKEAYFSFYLLVLLFCFFFEKKNVVVVVAVVVMMPHTTCLL